MSIASRFALALLIGSASLRLIAAVDPTALAADYYLTHRDYPQALQLWKQELDQQPTSFVATSRVADLKLMLEGREAARDTLLAYLNLKSDSVSDATRDQAKTRLFVIASTFLTDEGQSEYLQALPHLNHQDWSQALSLLNQANTLEKGNLKILNQKARCEMALALYDPYYRSLKQANEMDPFDEDTREALGEAEIYFKDYAAAIALLKANDDAKLSDKSRFDLGFALAETGNPLALSYLKPLAEKTKGDLPAVLYFELGKLLSAHPHSTKEAVRYLQNFVAQIQSKPQHTTATVDPSPIEPAVWDPYHTLDKASEARRLLLSLEPPADQSVPSKG